MSLQFYNVCVTITCMPSWKNAFSMLPSVEFLVYQITNKGVRMSPSKVTAVLDWPIPQDVMSLQSFLGFSNFYRRFIWDFSKIVAPLTALTSNKVKFAWDDTSQTGFDTLKNAFTTAAVHQHPDPALPFIVEADASDVAVGPILSQACVDTNELHPVAFNS
ncbi:uncharacterized protein [Ambystoma mexicanum]|uniref:uncharacterized protein n=1 Tax=Ambystoma mexicanum TaxID=8296 RepID=UPI0037E867D2